MTVRYVEIIHPLRKARQKKGWSLTHLADLCGIDRATICKIELGQMSRVSVQHFRQLGLALDCDWQTLVPSPDHPPTPREPRGPKTPKAS